MKILPFKESVMFKAGIGREEPNRDPYLALPQNRNFLI